MSAKTFADVWVCVAITFAGTEASAAANAAATRPVIANYERPLSFEPNRGQADERVDFLARGTGYSLFLSHNEAVIVLHRGGPATPGSSVDVRSLSAAVVRMRPVGADASVRADALGALPGKSNYFIGNTPERWRTRIPTYAKVRYRNVYPGVDLVYYGNQRQLEYDFVLSPGADPRSISVEIESAGESELDSEGNLITHTAAGDLRWRKPLAYQNAKGSRKSVQCDYVRRGGQRLGFALAEYDNNQPLIIDPELEYSTYLGGSGGDSASAIAVDAHENVYVTGVTFSDDFPIKNAFQSVNAGGDLSGSGFGNAFITKISSGGDLVYSTFLGGTGNSDGQGDNGLGIAVDGEGHAYVTGITGSSDFPTKNPFLNVLRTKFNAFVTKLAADGDALVYSTYLGGSGNYEVCLSHCGDEGNAITVDAHGFAYVTGFAQSIDFPTKNAFQKHLGGNPLSGPQNAFVTKLCPEGNALIYSTYLGGSIYDYGSGIAVDKYGYAYVTGGTGSLNFPVKNAYQDKSRNKTCSENGSGACSGFLTKLNRAGNELIYSTYFGGSATLCFETFDCVGDSASSIALDSEEHAYVTGVTYSADSPIKDAFQRKLKSRFGNGFVTEFDADGRSLVYSTYLGGCGNPHEQLGDATYGIAVDERGDAYIAGYTTSTDFPVKGAFQQHRKSQFGNAFVTKLNTAGTALVYSSYLGGSGGSCQSPGAINCSPSDFAYGIAVDRSGNAYVTGGTNAADFPTKNAFQPMLANTEGLSNAFVTKVSAH